MPIRFRAAILSHLQDPRYDPSVLDDLADQIGADDDELDELNVALQRLLDEDFITLDNKGRYRLPPIGRELTGRIKVHRKGFAFVMPDQANREGDLFIPPGDTLDAVTGDRVLVKVMQDRGRGKRSAGQSAFVGRVEDVLERRNTTFVGTLVRHGPYWLVEVDGNLLHSSIRVRDVGAKGAVEGEKVVVEVIEFPEPGEWANGVITDRLGEAGDPDVETQSVILAYGLPGEFPDECIDQARDIALDPVDINDLLTEREDLREKFIITIDPPEARDFDDAISIEKLDDSSGYELGIHIADVSTFIGPDSSLDVEAAVRGNSVYLPRMVIPMIPEILSNGLCSLQEDVDRLAKSVFVKYNGKGRVVSARFSRSVIRSAKRLTYLEAEALIAGNEVEAKNHAMSETAYPEPLIPTLQCMSELAGVIRKRRLKDGMIVLTLPEVELQYDNATGRVTGAEPEDDASTHGLIEMFMVEANEAVASLFDSLQIPILRRTHPDPSTFDVSELRQFCRVAGLNIPKNPSRFELQTILDLTRDTPRQQAVHLAVLKSLTKAEYSPALIGHFALASRHYAHFTSPIRRYPDLLLHRALDAWLDKTNNGRSKPKGKGIKRLSRTLRDDPRCLDEETLLKVGNNCNQTERSAELAESSLRTFLLLQFLAEEHAGDVFDGTVVGISSQVMWVKIDQYLVEGVVQVRDLSVPKPPKKKGDRPVERDHRRRADRWRLNPQTGALVHEVSGQTMTIGDRMKVRIDLIDPAARRLDLTPLDS